eukprot:6351789-Amphidinium_carterae.1
MRPGQNRRHATTMPSNPRLKCAPLTVDLCSFSVVDVAKASKQRKERPVSLSRSSDPSSDHDADARVERAASQAGAKPKA